MRVIGFERFGGPEVLRVMDMPKPEPQSGEVLIRVRAIGVNPTDALFREGGLRSRMDALGRRIPGRDLTGEIESVGPGVSWRPGAAVMAMIDPTRVGGGSYAEYVVVPEQLVAQIPPGMTYEAAASLPTRGITALLALDELALPPDSVIAVTGATGGVGSFILQLAIQRHISTIAVCREAYAARALSLGASSVVDASNDPAQKILSLAPLGVSGLVDCALTLEAIAPAIADCGIVAVLRDTSFRPSRGVKLRRVRVSEVVDVACALGRLRSAVESGVQTRVACVLPFESARSAHELMELGGLQGQVILAVN